MTRAVYPGSFNPPTIGHLEVMRSAIEHLSLTRLDLAVSVNPLGKGPVERPSLEDRLVVLRRSVEHLEIVEVVVTEQRLIADIAAGYDVVVMGADKWRQVNDRSFYDSELHLEDALARLPKLAVAARGDDPVPEEARLPLRFDTSAISSTGARSGSTEWMTPAARAFSQREGVWEGRG